MSRNFWLTVIPLGICIGGFCGCAEGPLWKTGHLSPWARQKWAEEEQIAPTLYAKRERMREIVDQATVGGSGEKEQASKFLGEIVQKNPVVLLRIEAAKLLGRLPTQTATQALQIASKDRESDVRLAAIRAWRDRRDAAAIEMLDEMIENDQDIDVRIQAISALGEFSDPRVAKILSSVLSDPDPAIQMQAATSLASVTGQDFGTDIQAWQRYIINSFGQGRTETADLQNSKQFN